MSVKIRLRRVGAKKQPSYRVVVADSRAPRDGRFIEVIGFYNPRTKPTTIQIDAEKARKWLGNGAQPTESVASLLYRAGIADLRSPRWRKDTDAPLAAQVAAPETASATAATAAPTEQAVAMEPAPVAPAATAQAAAAQAAIAPTEQTAAGGPQPLPGEDSGALDLDASDTGATRAADATAIIADTDAGGTDTATMTPS